MVLSSLPVVVTLLVTQPNASWCVKWVTTVTSVYPMKQENCPHVTLFLPVNIMTLPQKKKLVSSCQNFLWLAGTAGISHTHKVQLYIDGVVGAESDLSCVNTLRCKATSRGYREHIDLWAVICVLDTHYLVLSRPGTSGTRGWMRQKYGE